jgi:hypothetical protein
MKEALKGCVGFEGKKSKQVLREQSKKTFMERLKPKDRRIHRNFVILRKETTKFCDLLSISFVNFFPPKIKTLINFRYFARTFF